MVQLYFWLPYAGLHVPAELAWKELDKTHWNSKTLCFWVSRKANVTGIRVEGKTACSYINPSDCWRKLLELLKSELEYKNDIPMESLITTILAMLCCLILQLYLVPSIFIVLGVVSILQTSIDVNCHFHITFSAIVLHYGGINLQIILFRYHRINSPPRYMTIFYIMNNLM